MQDINSGIISIKMQNMINLSIHVQVQRLFLVFCRPSTYVICGLPGVPINASPSYYISFGNGYDIITD